MYVNAAHAQKLTGQFDRKHTLLSISLHFGDHVMKGILWKLLAVNLV